MMSDKTPIEKIGAIVTVIFLFALVGGLFWFISLNNKIKVDNLRQVVLRQQILNTNLAKLSNIELATTSLAFVSSQAFQLTALTDNNEERIVGQRNPELIWPLASLTKLMMAVVTLENVSPETTVQATSAYAGQEESTYVLELDKTYRVKDLLANALIASDNDSARLLAGILGENNFVARMNLKAQEIGLINTKFINSTGLDPHSSTISPNVSTVTDLTRLLLYIKDNHSEIFKITAKKNFDFCTLDNFCKQIISTDKLLDNPDFKFKIIGGKTGNTDLALKNLVLIMKPEDGITLIGVVLGANDNFQDMMLLINQINL